MEQCTHRQSLEIEKHIAIGAKGEAFNVGLYYKRTLLQGLENLYCDLCSKCGTVISVYVDQVDRKWLKD
ncbi:MAG: hypothetical protein JWN30_711 [Bacilli bacterium]|nr:hypothetical protein [Bacilli bacterium]